MACTQTQLKRGDRERAKTTQECGVRGIDAAVVGDAPNTWGWMDGWMGKARKEVDGGG